MVATSNGEETMILTPIFFNGSFNVEQGMANGDAKTNLEGIFLILMPQSF